MEIKIRDHENYDFTDIEVTRRHGKKMLKGFTQDTELSKEELQFLVKLLE